MRIAYSFAGEGLGHAARTSVIGPLLEHDHDVVYFVPEIARAFFASKVGRRRCE
jgi:UDP:flavonoid glycosyltransferase YjiC (YdhE family)